MIFGEHCWFNVCLHVLKSQSMMSTFQRKSNVALLVTIQLLLQLYDSVKDNYVSPIHGGDILFLPVLSFRPSICHTCFRSLTEARLGVGTSYLVCMLVMTSGWPLLILMSEGQRSRSWWPCEIKSGFHSITEERFILRSVLLKSRSQWPWAERSQWQWAEKLFLLGPRNFILGVQVSHYRQMTSIDFEITRSKVKVTSITLVSAQ